ESFDLNPLLGRVRPSRSRKRSGLVGSAASGKLHRTPPAFAQSPASRPQTHLIISARFYSEVLPRKKIPISSMDPEAAKTARESLELSFQMSNILDTGLDRHTLSVLIALCDLGLNPEALAAVVKELRTEALSSPPPPPASSSSSSS
ncbi:unnamed protein product, partial [Linum tenue]